MPSRLFEHFLIDPEEEQSKKFLRVMADLGLFGGLLILIYSLRFWASGQMLRIFGVAMLVAGAALLSGFLLGFIFAIPRVGEKKGKITSANPEAAGTKDAGAQLSLVQSNANLAEISDWLTKIIVGVGLVELRTITVKLGELSYYLALGLQPAPCPGGASCAESLVGGQVAGLAIVILYFSLGFLIGCVWTMIFFMQDLTKPYEDKIYIQQQKLDTAAPILSAEASISANQLDEAMATIEQHLRNNPRDGYAVMTKARILKRQAMQPGESAANRESLLKQAIRSVDESIALLPDKAEPIFNKACYQAQLDPNGLKDDILANLESAFRLNPSLRQVAKTDDDLGELRQDADFINIIGQESPPEA